MAGPNRAGSLVSDAGPLIHLDELGCLDLLQDFAEVLVPDAVWAGPAASPVRAEAPIRKIPASDGSAGRGAGTRPPGPGLLARRRRSGSSEAHAAILRRDLPHRRLGGPPR